MSSILVLRKLTFVSCWNVYLSEYRNLFPFVCYFIAMIRTNRLRDCKARVAAGFRNRDARTHSAPGASWAAVPFSLPIPPPPPPLTSHLDFQPYGQWMDFSGFWEHSSTSPASSPWRKGLGWTVLVECLALDLSPMSYVVKEGGSGSVCVWGGGRCVCYQRRRLKEGKGKMTASVSSIVHIPTSFHPNEVQSACSSDFKRKMTILLLLFQKLCFEVNSYISRKKSSAGWVQW